MSRLTSYKNGLEREMICRYEDCDTVEEYCPHLNEANCPCLQEVLNKLAEYEDLEEQGLLIRKTFELGGKAYIHQFNKEGVLVPVQGSVAAIGDDFVRLLIHDGRQLNIPKNSRGLFLTEQQAQASLQWIQAEVKEGAE